MNARPGFARLSSRRSLPPLLALLFSTVVPLSAQTIPAVWTSFDPVGFSATGTLGPLNLTASQILSPATGTADLSGTSFGAAPLSASQGVLDYEQQSDFTIRLNRPVKGLMLYLVAWRNGSYTFSEPFTLHSGLSGATIAGNTLTTTAGFTDGILRFNEPISSFSVSTPSSNVSRQDLTLAVVRERTSVRLRSTDAGRGKLRMSGVASATFGVRKVVVKNGRRPDRRARLSADGKWKFLLRPRPGITRVKYQAIGFDGTKSPRGTIRVARSGNQVKVR